MTREEILEWNELLDAVEDCDAERQYRTERRNKSNEDKLKRNRR